jgi:hypothetical protein
MEEQTMNLGAIYQSNKLVSPRSTVMRTPLKETAAIGLLTSKWPSSCTIALIVWITCSFVGVRFAAAQSTPTGTIELSGGSVAIGIGYTWGKGILIFEGKRYP